MSAAIALDREAAQRDADDLLAVIETLPRGEVFDVEHPQIRAFLDARQVGNPGGLFLSLKASGHIASLGLVRARRGAAQGHPIQQWRHA